MEANFPIDVIYEILQFLPTKSLHRFRCVCKDWNDMINSSDFVNSHLKHSLETSNSNGFLTFAHNSSLYQVHDFDKPSSITKLTYPDLQFSRVIGSYNGLICVYCKDNCLALCNPSIRTLKKVPNISLTPHSRLGFGYDHLGDDYKIVSLTPVSESVYVYSLNSDSWKTGVDEPCSVMSGKSFYGSDHGTLANTHLHWIQYEEVISFDLHKETWGLLPLPKNHYKGGQFWSLQIGFFKGCISIQVLVNDPASPGASRSDIWVMKEYGKIESWTKLLSFANDVRMQLVHSRLLERKILFLRRRIMVNFEDKLREGKREDFVEFLYDAMHGGYGGIKCVHSLSPVSVGNGNGGELRLLGEQVDLEELEKTHMPLNKDAKRKRKSTRNCDISRSPIKNQKN